MFRILIISCVIYGLSLGDNPDVLPLVTLNLGEGLDPDDISEGDDVYFECKIQNNPNPLNITWFHNGKKLHNNVTDGVILNGGDLGLQRVTRHRAGNYTCLAALPLFNITSNQISLKVMFEPTCKGPREQWFAANTNEIVPIICQVEAYPPVDAFQWTFNHSEEQTVVPSSRYITQGTVSRLNHTPVSDVDFGTFTCRAVNSVGSMGTPCVYHITNSNPEPTKTTQYLQNDPEGDTDSKYFIYHFQLNWIQAMELCFSFGKRPATFMSEAEYYQLTTLIRKKNGNDLLASYWTAGSDLGETGKYIWHSTGRPIIFTSWNTSEPDHHIYGNEVEHCIALKAENGYRMSDELCSKKNYVICENIAT